MNKVTKIVGGIIGVFILLLVIVALANPSSVKEGFEEGISTNEPTEEPEAVTVSEAETKKAQDSPAYALASLNNGLPNPSASEAQTFQAILDSLDRKCTENDQTTLADQIVKAKQLLEERNVEMSYLEVAQAVDSSIPEDAENLLSCAEVAAAFITLTVNGN